MATLPFSDRGMLSTIGFHFLYKGKELGQIEARASQFLKEAKVQIIVIF